MDRVRWAARCANLKLVGGVKWLLNSCRLEEGTNGVGGGGLDLRRGRCGGGLLKRCCKGGGGGDWRQVKLAVVNLAVGNLAEAPGFRAVNLADTPRKQAEILLRRRCGSKILT